jgi:hypothetical protein
MTLELHPAIASDELLDGLARFAAVEAFTEGEAQRVDEAAAALVEADRGNPAQRAIAAQNLYACRYLAEQSGPAQLDPEGLNSVRAAIAAGMHYLAERCEFEPPTDPRDQPRRLHPADSQTLEGQARLRHALASIRLATDTWSRVPGAYDLAAVVDLLERLSAGCHEADDFRATLTPPVPVPLNHNHRR